MGINLNGAELTHQEKLQIFGVGTGKYDSLINELFLSGQNTSL